MTRRKAKQLHFPFLERKRRRGVLSRFRLPLKRYMLVSTGIGVFALGLALTITGIAVSLTSTATATATRSAVIYNYYVPAANSLLEPVGAYQSPLNEVASAPPAEVASSEEAPAAAEPEAEPPESSLDDLVSNLFAAREQNTNVVVKGRITNVNITFYDCKNQGFCGNMANGRKVYEGAAACSWNLAVGTRFTIVGDPTQRIYVCEDRGLLTDTWVDIFWHDPADGWRWQAAVGRRGTIEIVDLPR